MKKPTLIPWYAREDWPRVLEVMADADDFPKTYDDWTRVSDMTIVEIYIGGGTTRRVRIKPDDFFAWCAQHGLPADSTARVQYIRLVAYATLGEDTAA